MPDEKKDKKELTPQDILNQRLEDIKAVLEMPGGAGKRYLRYIMETAGIYRTTYTGNAKTNFLEGRRSLATEIISDLDQSRVSRYDKADILI